MSHSHKEGIIYDEQSNQSSYSNLNKFELYQNENFNF